jgi:2-polyprenyl-3-methyl-5-hydroxy-6-metoxy-1,4-benzoquinol methylase
MSDQGNSSTSTPAGRSDHPLHDESCAVEFYQERYRKGYMEEWPARTKQRLSEVLREAALPPKGDALDFGCGNGVLTEVLRTTLPADWKVFGSDISTQALGNAHARYPNCTFFAPGDVRFAEQKFDLLFTHHVLEHVGDLSATLALMNDLLRDRAVMFHVLPCGNSGSLAHRFAELTRNGIDPNLEDRFFFEDEGHVRRLTSARLDESLKTHGFQLVKEYYTGQRDGVIEYFTDFGRDLVLKVVDPENAVNPQAASELADLRSLMLRLHRNRELARQYRYRLHQSAKSWKNYAYLLLNAPRFIVANAIDRSCQKKTDEEWRLHKTDRNGSEMLLIFQREGKSLDLPSVQA